MKNVTITAEEAESLANFIWLALIPFIQDKDNEVDNLVYIRNLTNVWKKCDDARKGGEDAADDGDPDRDEGGAHRPTG